VNHWWEVSAQCVDRALRQAVPRFLFTFLERTSVKCKPAQYVGTPQNEYAIVALGTGCDTIEDPSLPPIKAERILSALPSGVKGICILDKIRDITGVPSVLGLNEPMAWP
jgi:hypothetical protein